MGINTEDKTEIRISFIDEEWASYAYPFVEGMIICFYLFNEKVFQDDPKDVRDDPYQLLVLHYNDTIVNYDRDKLMSKYPDCALKYLRREGAEIILDQCAEIQGPVPDLQLQSREGFFNCLSFLLAWLYYMNPFQAICRYEKAGSDLVQETQVEFDTIVVHFKQSQGEPGNCCTADWMLSPVCVSDK